MRLKAGKSMLIGEVMRLVHDTSYMERFRNRSVKSWDSWYWAFRKRHGIGMQNQDKLEVSRAAWSTSANMLLWYNVLADCLVDNCKIAVRNPSFDPDKPYDVLFYVIDKDMLFEWDQTGVSLDQKDDGKASCERTMTYGKHDKGQTVSNKSSVKWSFTGGSFINGDALPGMATPPSVGMNVSDARNPPKSNMIDPETAQPYEMVFKPHRSGGFVAADAPGWFETCVATVLPKRAGKKGCGLCDGLSANIDYPVLVAAENANCHLCIRVPHSSESTQGCDLVNFPVLKREVKLNKSACMAEKLHQIIGKRKDGSARVTVVPSLTHADMMPIVTPAWEKAFSRQNNHSLGCVWL
jgi:hypothetical protein